MRRGTLQERDRQLIGVLAEARWLSWGQLKRLFYPGATARGMRRRLAWLADEEDPLLRKVTWQYQRKEDFAWGLTPAGYVVAEEVLETSLDVPRDDAGFEHMAHHVLLSELLVGLLEARVREALAKVSPSVVVNHRYRGVFARARHPHFAWNVVGERIMPWRQADPGSAKETERRLVPDAVLEFPFQRRRVFVESEMGTHTIAAVSDSKTGATLAKAKNYAAFFTLLESAKTGRTFYQARYPDGFAPEVLFLVRPTKGGLREKNVRNTLEAWRKTATSSGAFRVGTVESVLRDYLPLIGGSAPVSPVASAPPPVALSGAMGANDGLTADELRLLRNHAVETHNLIQSFRKEQRAQGIPDAKLLPYPKSDEAVIELVSRLRRAKG